MKKIKELWNAETPKLARYMQYASGIIAACIGALALFWNSLPLDWVADIPLFIKHHLVYIGGVATILPFFLQLFKKNDKEEKK